MVPCRPSTRQMMPKSSAKYLASWLQNCKHEPVTGQVQEELLTSIASQTCEKAHSPSKGP